LRNNNKNVFQPAERRLKKFFSGGLTPVTPCLRAWLMHAVDFCAFSFLSVNIHRYLTGNVNLLKIKRILYVLACIRYTT